MQQLLVLFILLILSIHVPYTANRFNGTWSLLPKGHKGPLFHSRMIRTAGRGRGPNLSEITRQGSLLPPPTRLPLPPRAGARRMIIKKSCPPAALLFLGERRSCGWPRSAEATSPTRLPYRAAQPRQHFALVMFEGDFGRAFRPLAVKGEASSHAVCPQSHRQTSDGKIGMKTLHI